MSTGKVSRYTVTPLSYAAPLEKPSRPNKTNRPAKKQKKKIYEEDEEEILDSSDEGNSSDSYEVFIYFFRKQLSEFTRFEYFYM